MTEKKSTSSKAKKSEEKVDVASTAQEAAAQEKSSEETVTVKKTDLDQILDRLDKKDQEINMLMKSADKARLAKVQAQEQGEKGLISKARVWRFGKDNKIVVGTKLVSNTAEYINGRYVEDQRLAVVFEDGKTEEVQLINFHRNVDRNEKGEIVSREVVKNKDGSEETMLTIELEDGRRVKLSNKYIN